MTTRSATALASMARGMLKWAAQRGIDTDTVISTDQHDELARAGELGRIPRAVHDSVWTAIEGALADPAFGLKSAASILTPASFGVVGLVAMTSATIGESIARATKYSRVLKDDVSARLSTTGDTLTVELLPRTSLSRAVADASLYTYLHFAEKWSGRELIPRAVFFRHAQPADTSVYECFRSPVHFGQPMLAIVFDRSVGEIPLLTAQPDVAAYLEGIADARLAEIEAEDGGDLRARISRAIRATLEDGSAELDDVARKMGMSPRTLQRALAAEGGSFRTLVDEVRWSIAAPLVAATDLPLEQIAERLGYSDGKAFRRAFRRWAASAPIDFRERGRATDGRAR